MIWRRAGAAPGCWFVPLPGVASTWGCSRPGAAPALGFLPPPGVAPAWGLRPGPLPRLGSCPAWGPLRLRGRSRPGPLPLGLLPLGDAPVWGLLPSLGLVPRPGLLPPGAVPARGCSLSGLLLPGAAPLAGVAPLARARATARWAGRVSIVDPPSVPSCIIIIAQVSSPPVLTFSDIINRHSCSNNPILLAFCTMCLRARL